jgi:large subunit ribosomal protein L29
MKNADIREMTTQELEERLEEDQNRIILQRINHTVSPLENPLSLRKLRREIARLKTELHRRELEGIEQTN